MTVIPPMTDPLSAYWEQPKTEDILVDNTHAVMSKRTFVALKDYSLSQPTGAYQGKMWKSRNRTVVEDAEGKVIGWKWLDTWTLCWYGPHPDPKYVSNNYRDILIID